MAGRIDKPALLSRVTVPKYSTLDRNYKYTNTANNISIRPPPPPPLPSAGVKVIRRTSLKETCDVPQNTTTSLHTSNTTNVLNDSDEQLHLRKYNIMSEELSPLQLMQRYQNTFPLRVFVSKGFYGSNERFTLSEGDVYNIHFVKKTTVVTVEDSSKVAYKVPITSSVQFGALHSPERSVQKTLDGYKYPKVSDIMALSPLPKAVRATVEFKGTAASNSVEKNEIFIIKEIKLNSRGNRRNLVVYSVTNSMIKCLFESCEAHFSTKPCDVRLFLPEILEHFPLPFPTTCYLFVNSETTQELPDHLTASAVTLAGESTDLSLIASSNKQEMTEQSLLVEIPIDLDIQVKVMQPKDNSDTESLSKQTYELMENLDISKLVQCDCEHDRPTLVLATQLQLGSKGIELVQSPAMKQWMDAHTQYIKISSGQHASSSVLGSVEDNNKSHHLSCGMQDENNSLGSPPIAPHQNLSDATQEIQIHELQADMNRFYSKFANDLASLKDDVWKLLQIVNSYVQSCSVKDNTSANDNSTQLYVSNALYSYGGTIGVPNQPSSHAELYFNCGDRDRNIRFLRTLDTANVSAMCNEYAM